MTRSCGTCSLCCKLLGIVELNKPRGRWCQHFAKGIGCNQYKDRPQSCRTFKCSWLQEENNLPDTLKPDRLHAVITTTDSESEKEIIIYLDDGYPPLASFTMMDFVRKAAHERWSIHAVHGSKHWMYRSGGWHRFFPVEVAA